MSEALAGLRVLELAQGISGPYCGKLMAGLGAEIIKVEPPEGDTARKAGPPGREIDIRLSSGSINDLKEAANVMRDSLRTIP